MKAVILSNEYGNVGFPPVCKYSKSMLPILNKPSLEYLIEFLGKNKFSEIYLISNSESEGFLQYFGSGEKIGVSIRYIKDRQLEGTAGCLRNVAAYLRDEACFLLANAGVILDFDLKDFIRFHKLNAAMVTVGFIQRNDKLWPFEGLQKDCVLIGPTVIGNNCEILKGTFIRESIVWDNCIFPEESRIDTCIITDSNSIKKGVDLKNRVTLPLKSSV